MASSIVLSDNGVSSGSAGIKSSGGNDGTLLLQTTTSGGTATTAVTVDNAQNVGVGVTPSAWAYPAIQLGTGSFFSRPDPQVGIIQNGYSSTAGGGWKYVTTAAASYYNQTAGAHAWFNAASGTAGNTITWTQAMTLDSSGILTVPAGVKLYQLIGSAVANNISWDGAQFFPQSDNTNSNGYPGKRWTVIYAANGTINTSDANQKQDIAELDSVEKLVAIRIKSLIKKYRFKDAVVKKGDDARIHIGAIAQEVAAAFVAEGLDPTRYGLFCSDTWYEVDGKMSDDLVNSPYTAETEGAIEVTQLGLRYEELLAFVIAAL
jgi:hypothetical protein